jgi:predicted transcriptional regulator
MSINDIWYIDNDKISIFETLSDERYNTEKEVLDQIELGVMQRKIDMNLLEREKQVIDLYYFEGKKTREIGEILGVTESRVSQIHRKALLRIRNEEKNSIKTTVKDCLKERREALKFLKIIKEKNMIKQLAEELNLCTSSLGKMAKNTDCIRNMFIADKIMKFYRNFVSQTPTAGLGREENYE